MLIDAKEGQAVGTLITKSCFTGQLTFKRLIEILEEAGEFRPGEELVGLSVQRDQIQYYLKRKE